jgi:hypothetical protein
MSDEAARIARAEQAQAALNAFLGPAFDICRADYLEKLGEIASRPMTDANRAGMEKLALGVKVIDMVRGQITAVVADGGMARSSKRQADQLANLSAEAKWYAQW